MLSKSAVAIEAGNITRLGASREHPWRITGAKARDLLLHKWAQSVALQRSRNR